MFKPLSNTIDIFLQHLCAAVRGVYLQLSSRPPLACQPFWGNAYFFTVISMLSISLSAFLQQLFFCFAPGHGMGWVSTKTSIWTCLCEPTHACHVLIARCSFVLHRRLVSLRSSSSKHWYSIRSNADAPAVGFAFAHYMEDLDVRVLTFLIMDTFFVIW